MFNKVEYKHQYYLAHKEQQLARQHERYLDHKEEILEQCRQYRLDHKEQLRARNQRYYLDHKERIKAQAKAYRERCDRQLKYEVLAHYSIDGLPQCGHCGIVDIDVLTIDHINGDGRVDRKTGGHGANLYHRLRKNNFPEGYQTLCFNCNIKKYIQEGRAK